ncbi:MAG TPA: ROK family protein [Candidatus Angelobacter sp.]
MKNQEGRSNVLLGAIEAGGTKFCCAVGTPDGNVIREILIPTTTPEETMRQVIEFFLPQGGKLAAIGVGSFGPIQLNRDLPKYGCITNTPKNGWVDFDLLGSLQSAFPIPVALDTDVNVAALAEVYWGTAQGLNTFVYITVGTGIGGGALVEGNILHGLTHPEMGHIRIPHDKIRDPFPGICPYHGDCLEGLASGPALEARWGITANGLPQEHPAWSLEAEYLAMGCVNWICTLSPERVILGGGVMQQRHLFALIRDRVVLLLKGYLDAPEIIHNIDSFIVPSSLTGRSGILGALALARLDLKFREGTFQEMA